MTRPDHARDPVPAGDRRAVRVTHVITGLARGGAEIMLLRLLGAMDRARFAPEVVSLRGPGVIGPRIAALGIPVHDAGLSGGLPRPSDLRRLTGLVRRARPDLVHTWMYHADLFGGLAARLGCGIPVIWALHNSTLDPRQVKLATRATVRLNALLSRWLPSRIVSCSETAAALHRDLGYAADKLLVIPNGFDVGVFAPDPAARAAVRAELGLADGTPLVGSFARFHPQKDHRTLCDAAGRVAAANPAVHFVLAGEGIEWTNATLAGWIAASGSRERFHLLGERDDMPRLTAALDLLVVSSSFGEAFPLVIGEAMASEVPCVVTDVGDARQMVGDTGRVVPPRDPAALAGAIGELLRLTPESRAGLGRRARDRVARELSLAAIAERYQSLYLDVLGETARRTS